MPAATRRFSARTRRTLVGLGIGLLLTAVAVARVLNGCPVHTLEPLPVGERFSVSYEQVEVVDGDTVRVDGHLVRLLGADTPEKETPYFTGDQQPHARRATQFTRSQLREASSIRVELLPTRDRYNRLLGHFFVDGESISLRLVRAGHAYETVSKYGDNGFPEVAAAIEAAAEQAEPAFQTPSDWRREHRID